MATVIYPEVEANEVSLIRWGAIFAGAIIALVTQIVLGLLGMAVGLSSLNPATSNNALGVGIGTGVWLVISTLISLYLGAMVASWFGNTHLRFNSILHGILVWGLFMLVSFFFLSTTVMGGMFSMISAGLTGASQAATVQAAQHPGGQNANAAQQRGAKLSAHAGPATQMIANLRVPAAVKAQIGQDIASGNTPHAAQLISQNTGMNPGQANNLAQQAGTEVQQARANGERTVENAAGRAGKAAWIAFGMLLLSLIVSILGGIAGARVHFRVSHS